MSEKCKNCKHRSWGQDAPTQFSMQCIFCIHNPHSPGREDRFEQLSYEPQEILDKVYGFICRCGWEFTRQNTHFACYPHAGGMSVAGFKEKQWVYFKCPACEYAWSFYKIVHHREAKPVLMEEI